MGLLKEFKEFALRGNVVDMAVAIIIGAAFTGVVTSLVGDVMMPVISAPMQGLDFSKGEAELRPAEGDKKPIMLRYGAFINAIIGFTITAFAVFLLVKIMNTLIKKEPAPPGPPPAQELLLTEIRDLLKARSG